MPHHASICKLLIGSDLQGWALEGIMQHLVNCNKGLVMNRYLAALARVLLGTIFLGPVILRLMSIMSHPDGYAQYQALLGHFGLPGLFAPLLILIQLIGGLALVLGFKTRFFAFFLAAFALFLAFVLGRLQPEVMFLYLGIAGGLVTLGLNPSTPLSLDGLKKA